jgi:pyruvate-formate lyase-activating enzyme
MREYIFYGAGLYAHKNFKRWLSDGFIPACFADLNEKKHYTKIGEYEILPLSEALEKYPECKIGISVAPVNYPQIVKNLIDCGISRDKLVFFDDIEYRIGCHQLGTFILLSGEHLSLCCPIDREKKSNIVNRFYNDIFEDGIKGANDDIRQLIENHRCGNYSLCDGCHYLRETYFTINPFEPVKHIIIGTGFKEDICNTECFYCTAKTRLKNNKNKNKKLKETIIRIFEMYGNVLSEITFGNGEFFARGDADEILEYLEDKSVKVSFITNASIYSETLMRMIRIGRVNSFMCSLDSGTRETYIKVKNRDFFDKVTTNIKKYVAEGLQNLYLKYILLPDVNDNTKDIEGFIDIAKQTCAKIHIAPNVQKRGTNLPEATLNMSLELYEKSKNKGLHIEFLLEHFSESDRLFIQTVID